MVSSHGYRGERLEGKRSGGHDSGEFTFSSLPVKLAKRLPQDATKLICYDRL